MKNKKGFTLLEVLLSVLILSILIGTILTIFTDIKGADGKMANKRILVAEASDLIDRIHEAALDYTIDYEEYFNHKYSGFGSGNINFTSYGNSGRLYYCKNANYLTFKYQTWMRNSIDGGCVQSNNNQKYLEYFYQHRNLENPTTLNSSLNSGAYKGIGPIAISPNTGIDYLYLINEDGTERYYFRRIQTATGTLNAGGYYDDNQIRYTIQMLKLKGYDAGSGYNFNSRGAYDGFIDTRACDSAQGFYCNGKEIQNGNKMPIDENDGRISITSDKVTVSDMKIDIYPAKDPYLAINEPEYRIDPYAKISFTMMIYGEETKDKITITSTYGFKNSYSKFPIVKYPGYIPQE